MYGLQHGALALIEQQAIKGPNITSVKPFNRENQWSKQIYITNEKRETRINLNKQTTTTVHTTFNYFPLSILDCTLRTKKYTIKL